MNCGDTHAFNRASRISTHSPGRTASLAQTDLPGLRLIGPLGRDQLLRRRASSFAVRPLGLQRSHLPEFRDRFRLANVPSRVPNKSSSERVFRMRTGLRTWIVAGGLVGVDANTADWP